MILRNSKIKDPAPLWATTIQVPPLSSSAPSTELPSARRCRMLIQTSSCNSTDSLSVAVLALLHPIGNVADESRLRYM